MVRIDVKEIINPLAERCVEISRSLRKDVVEALNLAHQKEKGRAKKVLELMLANISLARREKMPLCQDTGLMTVFVEIGQQVYLEGNLMAAINQGVRLGYQQGYLRKSVVRCPLKRENTGDNTPAVVHFTFVPGKKLKLTLLPKGFGAENMSRFAFLKPTEGEEGIVKFVVEAVRQAGANPCPPVVLGVGIGGTMEKAAFLAKKALLRPLNSFHPQKHLEKLEKKLLREINKLGLGPQGIGGKTTCLGVKIETYPTHIAGLPVAVNFSCYALRQGEVVVRRTG